MAKITVKGDLYPGLVEKYKKYYGSWNTAKYERAVEDVLLRLKATESGKAVIANMTKDLVITLHRNPGEKNAGAQYHQNGSPKGSPFYFDAQCKDMVAVGTGLGVSDCVIGFTPLVFAPAGTSPSEAGSAADQVLCHEMVHAMRQMAALNVCLPVAGGFDNREELIAITVENVLSSETGRKLRLNHHDHQEWRVKDPGKESEVYYRRYRATFDHLLETQGAFCQAMAKVPAPFNPFVWGQPGKRLSDKEMMEWSKQADKALQEALIGA